MTLPLHSWWRPLVYTLASVPLGLLLLEFSMANYLDRVGIHYSYTTNWFAGFRTFYQYNRLARTYRWPMGLIYLYWAGVAAFAVTAAIFVLK